MPTDDAPVRDVEVSADVPPTVTTRDISAEKPPRKKAAKRTPRKPAHEESAKQLPENTAPDRVLGAVERLRTHIATLPLAFTVPGIEGARRDRDTLIGQLDDYLLPRLRRPDAPLLAVIGGSTGAG